MLSREEEAYYGYLAAVNSTTLADGAVLDLGGGSLQLVEVVSRHPGRLGSWPLGAVRMTEHFLADDDPPPKKARKALRAHVARDARARTPPGCRASAAGSSASAARCATSPPPSRPRPACRRSASRASRSRATRSTTSIERARRRCRPPSAATSRASSTPAPTSSSPARSSCRRCSSTAASTRSRSPRPACARASSSAQHLDGDPPLFDDVRRSSVANLAARYHVEPAAHRARRARSRSALFDELAAAGLHPGDRWERELLCRAPACCTTSACRSTTTTTTSTRATSFSTPACRASRRARSRSSRRPRATTARACRTSASSRRSPRTATTTRLDRLAILLRLAEDLERSRDQSVRAAHVARRQRHDPPRARGRRQRARVERWAAQREVDLFERAFGTRPEGRGGVMSLTRGSGPLGGTPGATANYTIESPAHRILFEPDARRLRAFVGDTRRARHDGARTCCTRPGSGPSSTRRSRTSTPTLLERTDTHDALPVQGRRVVLVAARRRRAARGRRLGLRGSRSSRRRGCAASRRCTRARPTAGSSRTSRVAGGLRDPYHRVDVHTSSRPVRVTRGRRADRAERPPDARLRDEPARARLPAARRRHRRPPAPERHDDDRSLHRRRDLLARPRRRRDAARRGAYSYELPRAEAMKIAGLVCFAGEGVRSSWVEGAVLSRARARRRRT